MLIMRIIMMYSTKVHHSFHFDSVRFVRSRAGYIPRYISIHIYIYIYIPKPRYLPRKLSSPQLNSITTARGVSRISILSYPIPALSAMRRPRASVLNGTFSFVFNSFILPYLLYSALLYVPGFSSLLYIPGVFEFIAPVTHTRACFFYFIYIYISKSRYLSPQLSSP